MPYPHEHACRIQSPKDFQKDSFKRMSSGKVDIILGKLPGKTTTTTQAFRYPIETWTEAKAKAHCERQKGAFEAAKDIEKQAEEGGGFFSVMEEDKMEEDKKDTGTLSMEIFRVGDYGKNGNYTEADLDEMIASYDTSIHEAPIAIGHERKDGDPAHGWVSKLYRKGQSLWAEVRQVSEDLKAWIKDGRYKKRSVEIYKDFQNTGKKYLRAVAFVQIPEVKGMQDIALAERFTDDNGPYECLDFGELADEVAADELSKKIESIWWALQRRIHGEDNINKGKPSRPSKQKVKMLLEEAVKLLQDLVDSEDFTEGEDDMKINAADVLEAIQGFSEEDRGKFREALGEKKEEKLAKFEEELKAEKAAREKAEALLQAKEEAERKQRIATFANELKKKGLAPALVDLGVSAFYETLDVEKVVMFAEGKEETPAQFFERFCDAIVEQGKKKAVYVEFKEMAEGVAAKDKQHADRQRAAFQDFEEHRDVYEKLGLSAKDIEKYGEAA